MDKHYEEPNDKETVFARWLNGTLTADELKTIEENGDAIIFQKIVAETDTWSLPDLDESYYSKLQEKLDNKKSATIRPLNPFKRIASIAAGLLLLLGGITTYFVVSKNDAIKYTCEAGKTLEVTLPDASSVVLSGASTISYSPQEWAKGRSVTLDGMAYFKVTKKGSFVVNFEKGKVEVLGTTFTILSGTSMAMVKCYEGKVKVSSPTIQGQILTKGKAVRFTDEKILDAFDFEEQTPNWLSGESSFSDAPLIEVINALSVQYNTQFDIPSSVDLNRKYTGKFIHQDLTTALSMVFTPMNIQYSIEGEKRKIVTLK